MNITAIAIVAIISWTIITLSGRGKKQPKQATKPDIDYDQRALENKIDTLQERIAVLEAIVTDEKYALRRELDSLSRNRAA